MSIVIGGEYDFRIKNPGRRPDHCCRVRLLKVESNDSVLIFTCRRNDNGAVVVAFEEELKAL